MEICEPIAKSLSGDLPEWVPIKGIITADVVDADEEEMDQRGIDWRVFKAYGSITDGHPYSRSRVVGRPSSVQFVPGTPDYTRMEGRLFVRDCPRGRDIYNQHRTMLQSGGSGRGLGFSIEGQALARHPKNWKRITKSIIHSVAIDAMPKVALAWMDPIMMGMSSLAKGQLGIFDADVQPYLERFRRSMTRQDMVRADLLKGVTNHELAALRIARKVPSLSFAECEMAVSAMNTGRKTNV
jgi:hypothetical protein